MPQFARYLGVDYSGAETADSSCKGLRVYVAEGSGDPEPIQPPASPRRYWTRRGLAEWLCEELATDTRLARDENASNWDVVFILSILRRKLPAMQPEPCR